MLVGLRSRGFPRVNELDIFLKKIDEIHHMNPAFSTSQEGLIH
jgi:hypothetical protein